MFELAWTISWSLTPGIGLHDFTSEGLFVACSKPEFARASNIVSEYDQEIPQSQTADNPVAQVWFH